MLTESRTWIAPSINDVMSISPTQQLTMLNSNDSVNRMHAQDGETDSIVDQDAYYVCVDEQYQPFRPFELEVLDKLAVLFPSDTGEVSWNHVAIEWHNLWISQKNAGLTVHVLPRNAEVLQHKYDMLRDAQYECVDVQDQLFSIFELETLDTLAPMFRSDAGTVQWSHVAMEWYNLWISQKNAGLKEHVLPRSLEMLQRKYHALNTAKKRITAKRTTVDTVADIQNLDASETQLSTLSAQEGSISGEGTTNTAPAAPPITYVLSNRWTKNETACFVTILDQNPGIKYEAFNVEWTKTGFAPMSIIRFTSKKTILKRTLKNDARKAAKRESTIAEQTSHNHPCESTSPKRKRQRM